MDSKIKLKEVLSAQSDKKEKEVREEVNRETFLFIKNPKQDFLSKRGNLKLQTL